MNKLDLTFGIPMYNAEEYILELLHCFKDTNLFTYEIIIVDDGSSDDSYRLCSNFSNDKIKLFRKENGGVSSTRNFIINNAKGNWITFIDSDDLIKFEEYIQSFIELKKTNNDFLINVDNSKMVRRLRKKKNKINVLVEKEIINSPCMKFYNMQIINDNNIRFDEKLNLGEDLLFNLEYLKHCKCIGFFDNRIYEYRDVNSNSLTHKYRENKFEVLMDVYERCCNIFDKEKAIYYSFEYIRIKNCLSCLKTEMSLAKRSSGEIKEYINKMKKYKKMRLILASGAKENLVYYSWHILPTWCLECIMKIMLQNRKKGKR